MTVLLACGNVELKNLILLLYISTFSDVIIMIKFGNLNFIDPI